MAAPTTAVAICNLALDRLGQATISSITSPTTAVEEACARHYDATRREMLRRYIFNFSKKYATLTEDATKTPAFGWSTAYALPNDFVRLLSLGDVTIKNDLTTDYYELSEGYIFTDYGENDGSVNIGYIYDAQTVTKFDPLFIKVLYLQMAMNMAYKFSLKNSLVQAVDYELKDALKVAAAVCGQEKPPRRIERSRIRDVRRRGGSLKDNRYV